MPKTIKSKPKNTSTLNFGECSKNILEIKYINMIFNETIIAGKVTSGARSIECTKTIVKK